MTKQGNLSKKILIAGIVAYTTILTLISWYKYFLLGYNGLDLAIFDNIFFNAISGSGFWSSIQGHHYFADHFTPLLYLFLPFYALWPSPLNLLFVQSLLLGLSALPVYLLGKTIINQKWGVILALAWLANPLLWNINLHEWHILPLAIPLLLLVYYFYLQNDFKKFIIFIILAMLVREDVVVATIMFSLLGWLDKKGKKWIVAPAGLSLLYFIFTMTTIASLRPGGSRFLIYYQWIFESSPLQIVLHILNISNWEMALGLLLSFLFLPLFYPRYLILALGVLAQIVLVAGGSGSVIIDTHYSSLFIPALIISSIWGVKKIKNNNSKISRAVKFDLILSKVIIIACLFYLWLTLGPGYGIISRLTSPQPTKTDISKLVDIPQAATIASSYAYLPLFSTRENIYPLHYLLIGKQQFSLEPFPYKQPDYIILDLEDLIAFEIQLKNTYYFSNFYPQGYKNLENLIRQGYELITFNHQFAIWKKNQKWKDKYFEDAGKLSDLPDYRPQFSTDKLALVSWQWNKNLLQITWQKQNTITENLFIKITGDNFSYIRPLSLFIPTSLWKNKQLYKSVIFVPPDKKDVTITIGTISGRVEIDNWRGIKINYDFTAISPDFTITKNQPTSPDK